MAEVSQLDADKLLAYITGQRWFASKAREVAHTQLLDRVQLRSEEPTLDLALAEVRFQPGTHETYQLLLGGEAVYDALADPLLGRELVQRIAAGGRIETPAQGTIEFHPAD